MSKISNYLFQEANWLPIESDIREIRNIVLEEAGFRWIPVSERLPEANEEGMISDDLFVTTEDGNVDILYYDLDTKEWSNGIMIFEVLAWMPLPKPYQP